MFLLSYRRCERRTKEVIIVSVNNIKKIQHVIAALVSLGFAGMTVYVIGWVVSMARAAGSHSQGEVIALSALVLVIAIIGFAVAGSAYEELAPYDEEC